MDSTTETARVASPTRRTRGAVEPLHPSVVGSIVGAIGATTFVLANRGLLPGPWPTVAVLAWLVLLVAAAWTVLLRRRVLTAPPPPARRAGLVYVAAVGGMLLAMAAGRLLLAGAGHEDLQPAVVVLAVGLHFVPFARAFRAPVFATLGALVATLGVAGLVGGLLWGATAAGVAAVLAGLVMLAVIAAEAASVRDGAADVGDWSAVS